MAAGALPVEDAVGIACQIADALAHTHQHGSCIAIFKPGTSC